MKKVFISCLFVLMCSSWVAAQNIVLYAMPNWVRGEDITNTTIDLYGTFSSSDEYFIDVENTASSKKNIVVVKRKIQTLENAEISFCWYNCYGDETDIAQQEVDANSSKMFTADYKLNSGEGTSIVRYVFYDEATPKDSVYVEFRYNTYNSIVEQNLNNTLIYPNPCTDKLHITNAEGNIWKICDIMGRNIATGMFSMDEIIDVNTLSKGVYVVYILQDEQIVDYKKFIKK